jgi:hypothetical protein
MTDTREPRFPELSELWRSHDLALHQHYVEYSLFREIALADGAPVQVGVPRCITDRPGEAQLD